jgi:hypothetical protein
MSVGGLEWDSFPRDVREISVGGVLLCVPEGRGEGKRSVAFRGRWNCARLPPEFIHGAGYGKEGETRSVCADTKMAEPVAASSVVREDDGVPSSQSIALQKTRFV